MRTILITGGAGFIGSNLVRQLVRSEQYRVINVDKLTYAGNLFSLKDLEDSPNYTFVQGDIGDGMLMLDLLHRYQCDGVMNLAAESHVDRSIGSPGDFVQTNVVGTYELLEATREYWQSLAEEKSANFRFIHVSTDEVFGSLGDEGAFTESTPYSPNSPYSASKASSDHLVRAYHETFALPTITTHCSNNYGPYQFPEKLIPLIIAKAVEGKPLPVYGTGLNVRDWLHVEDHCTALRTIYESGNVGETYNIGGGTEKSNLDVVNIICDTVDRLTGSSKKSSDKIEFVRDRPGHDFRYAIDCSKLNNDLGWQAAVSFEQGIEATVKWYLANSDWVESTRKNGYDGQRLGIDAEGNPSAGITASDMSDTAPNQNEDCPFEGVVFNKLGKYEDNRGWLIELFRNDEVPAGNEPVMAYMSQTLPGVSRGPHEHVDQSDLFGFFGPGDFRLYLWDSRKDSPTFGQRFTRIVGATNPQSVIVPPGVVHAYKNVSLHPGIVFNAPNRLYAGQGKQDPVDEIRHEEADGSEYQLIDA
ncbi:dTDP-glucose 4,6-dehydratase [Rubripirellula tenax]|uniref:dTDP-glucose 4,6-dehydratase n=1 Tax=Rubripirellula tenax TaxID=2528015 RepID=A0A5C6F7D3_9BACT|nr:dTDP-glucose 4,6-dehydratase [Rubripirellula tenax]TWU56882.1 dTDP-glucose 4,6-dehydratase [Rubripirellula tenax]